MASTARAAIPYPLLTDSPDVPRDIKAVADRVDATIGTPGFATASYPVTGNYEGRLILDTTLLTLMRWSGSAWVSVGPKLFFGTNAGVVTDANGIITIDHGAPFTPVAVVAWNQSAGASYAQFWGVSGLTATQASLRWGNATSNALYATLNTGAFAFLCLA